MAGKTLVAKLDVSDSKAQRKVMKTVAKIRGIKSIKVEAEASKLTVECEQADPVEVVTKLRRARCWADIVTVGPIKDEKKEAEKKKKEEEKKKKKEEEEKKKEEEEEKKKKDVHKHYDGPPRPVIYYYYPPRCFPPCLLLWCGREPQFLLCHPVNAVLLLLLYKHLAQN